MKRAMVTFAAAMAAGMWIAAGCTSEPTAATSSSEALYMAQVAAAPEPPPLPKGHPDVSKMKEGSAAGTAAGGMNGMPPLPAGHPDMSQMRAAATQPAVLGKLSIRAVQGTKDGPAVGADAATVEAYFNAELVKRVEVTLDASGSAVVDQIPFGAGYEQLVRVTHAGVEYANALESSDKGSGSIDVPVYESTDKMPDWKIRMLHMMAEPAEGGIGVLEVVAVENPTDRAWVGNLRADGKRETLKLPLPAGTKNVQLLEGFHDCCTQVDDAGVTNTMALAPGVTQFKLGYVVMPKDGKIEVTAVPPAPVKMMMVLVPNDKTNITAEGLEGPAVVNMGRGDVRYFKGNSIAAGKELKITFPATATAGGASSAGASPAVDSSQTAKVVAGIGGLMIFLVGGMLMFLRNPKSSKRNKAGK